MSLRGFFHNPKALTMLGTMLALFLAALDQTIIATALPEIVRELGDLEHLSWVFTAYLLASTVTVPLFGKLSDRYGRRPFFLAGIVIFLAGSALSGTATSMLSLALFRGLQGIGGGAIMVNAFAVIGDLFPPAERARWQGLISSVWGAASIAGPLVGGVLTDLIGWRSIFYINIPIGLLALAVIALTLSRSATAKTKGPLDVWGAGTLSVALASLLLAVTSGGHTFAWLSLPIFGLLFLSVISFAAFYRIERRARDPILPLSLFRNRAFTHSVAGIFLMVIAMFSVVLFLPLFAQGVVGFSAIHAGLILTPLVLSMVVVSTVNGQIIFRTGRYKPMLLAGLAMVATGVYLLSSMTADTTANELIRNMIIIGLGLGVSMPVFTMIAQSAFGRERLGVVTATAQLSRSVGASLWTALLGGVFSHALALRLNAIDTRALGGDSGATIQNVQSLLTPAGQEAARTALSSFGPEASAAQAGFDGALHELQIAFSGALSDVYTVALVVIIAGIAVAYFMPAIPLRRTHRTPAEEAAIGLEEELGMLDARHEPRRR